jgi:hypothetical protein
MQAWNDRCAAATLDRWAKDRRATPRREAPHSPDQDPVATASLAAPQPPTRPLEPVPPATLAPETAASAAPTPDPQPPKPPEAVALQAPQSDVRAPYPFSVMNPAAVPEEVWQRARSAKGST